MNSFCLDVHSYLSRSPTVVWHYWKIDRLPLHLNRLNPSVKHCNQNVNTGSKRPYSKTIEVKVRSFLHSTIFVLFKCEGYLLKCIFFCCRVMLNEERWCESKQPEITLTELDECVPVFSHFLKYGFNYLFLNINRPVYVDSKISSRQLNNKNE